MGAWGLSGGLRRPVLPAPVLPGLAPVIVVIIRAPAAVVRTRAGTAPRGQAGQRTVRRGIVGPISFSSVAPVLPELRVQRGEPVSAVMCAAAAVASVALVASGGLAASLVLVRLVVVTSGAVGGAGG